MSERWLVALTEYGGLTRYTGGIGTHYASLLPAVVRRGIDVDLVLFSAESLPPEPDLDGVALAAHHRLRWVPEWAQLLLRPLLLRRQLRRVGYDRVFTPEWGGVASALPASAALVTNLATGIRLGDWIAERDHRDYPRGRRLARVIQNRLEDRQIRRSAGIVPISRAVLEWNEKNLPGLPPARIVRNCVNVAAIRRVVAARSLPPNDPGDEPTVFFVGRLERRKGILPTMRAFAEVVNEHPGARLQLAGSSGDSRFEPSRAELLEMVPERHRGQVEFLGHLDGGELFRRAANATVVLCPSIWEGFGNVALEIKAVGVPLVVSSGSGYDDFCLDEIDCLVVAPNDPRALADAVLRITADPQLAAQLVRGGELSVENFTPDAVAPDLIAAVVGLST